MDTRFPGVYTQLVDTSFGIPSSGVSTAFIAFISEKGRDNQLVSIGSVEELLSTFGSIDSGKYGQGMLVLSNWFSAASSAYCVRVMPDVTNVPAMTYSYANLYGKYSNTSMNMIEAGYANLAIVVNSLGSVELRNIAPKYYGSLKRLNAIDPPSYTNLSVGDRFAVSYAGKNTATGAWVGHDGEIATVKSISSGSNTVTWSYTPMDTIGYCKAYNRNYYLVNYTITSGTYTSSWQGIEPEFDRFESGSVIDILGATPSDPEIGDAYFVAAPISGQWWEDYKQSQEDEEYEKTIGKIATFNGWVDGEQQWIYTTPDRVVVGNDNYIYLYNSTEDESNPVNYEAKDDQDNALTYVDASTGLTFGAPRATFANTRFIVGPNPVGSWEPRTYTKSGVTKTFNPEGKIAYLKPVGTGTGTGQSPTGYVWEFLTVYTTAGAYPRCKEVIVATRDQYSTVNATWAYYCYSTRPNYKTVQMWTRNPDVLFPAYLNRTSEMDSILSTSRPDLYSTTTTGEYLFILHAIGRGSYYNNIQVSMSLSTKSMLQEEDYNRTMILNVYDTNSGSKVLLESFEVSLNPEARDAVSDTSIYIVNILNNYSKILRCRAIDPAYLTRDYKYMENINTRLDELFTEYERYNTIGTVKLSPSLAGGYDGNLYNGNDTINWNVAKNLLAKAYTGLLVNPNANDESDLYLTDVLDTEMVLIDVVLDAGYPKEVKVAINDMITARSNDCIGIIDQLDNASSELAYKARTDETGITKGFNTPYIAIYEPYSEIYDRYTGNNIWVTPIYHAAKAFAVTDRDYGRHYAPAGATRGLCTGINKLRYNLYKDNAYKEKFVTYCINPIICNRLGYVIYGQSTSYLKQTKLQDINIVRTIIEIERDLKLQLGTILFDLNDANTLMTIDSAVRAYLGNKMANDVIEGYDCKVYATDYDVTQHRARVDLVIVPKSVLYQIFITISV